MSVDRNTLTWRILVGDVREQLRALASGSVQCVVTSPPYWSLRDYQTPGQIGLEATPVEYVEMMVSVCREVWRVLRDDGTFWCNLGDAYAGSGGFSPQSPANVARANGDRHAWGQFNPASIDRMAARTGSGQRAVVAGLKPKDLCGMPWRVAFALQADGWFLRSDIIWAKPNPMPESVTDRPTKAHEYVFLLTKRERYFYDAEAIAETGTVPAGTKGAYSSEERWQMAGLNSRPPEYWTYTGKRNARSVWTIPTQPFSGAHFAVFPEALPERCILAGTSAHGACAACGAPWRRVMDRTNAEYRPTPYDAGRPDGLILRGTQWLGGQVTTLGWQPSCACAAGEPVPCVVLDPFCGSGTTGYVAIRHGRSFTGIELNPGYADLARTRLAGAAPLFSREAAPPALLFAEGAP